MVLEERGDSLVVEARRLGGPRQAGEGNGGVWLGDGGAELTKQRVHGRRGKKVMVLHGFKGARDVSGKGTKASRADEALRGRAAFKGRVDEGNVGRKEGIVKAEE